LQTTKLLVPHCKGSSLTNASSTHKQSCRRFCFPGAAVRIKQTIKCGPTRRVLEIEHPKATIKPFKSTQKIAPCWNRYLVNHYVAGQPFAHAAQKEWLLLALHIPWR